MKKLFVMLVSLICVLSLSSCFSLVHFPTMVSSEDNGADVSDTSDTSVESKTSAQQTFNLGDTVEMNDWYVTVNSFDFRESIKTSEYFGFTPDSGNKYAVANITIKNVGTSAATFFDTISFTGGSVRLIYDNKYKYSSSRLLGSDEDLHDETCNPLTELTGIMAFEVPDEVESSDKPLHLTIVNGNTKFIVKIR